MKSSIRWRLALSFATIALLAALALGAILLAILLQSYAERERAYLTGNAAAISSTVTQLGAAGLPEEAVKRQIEGLAFLSQARVRWLAADGTARLDTGTPKRMDVAFGGPLGGVMISGPFTMTSPRPPDLPPAAVISMSLGLPTLAAAGPAGAFPSVAVEGGLYGFGLNSDPVQPSARSTQVVTAALTVASGAVIGAIELSEGPAYGRDILTSVARGWLVAGLLAVLLASLAGWLVSGRITAPLHSLAQAAGQMAGGDLTARAPIKGRDELGQMAAAFNRMADQVESTIVTLRQFVADAAHQMHTPLTALRTNLELAAGRPDAAQSVHLERAQGQVARLTALTDELLQLSRIEAGGADAEPLRFDLARLVRGQAEAQAARAEQAGLDFILDVPHEPVWLTGQPEQIRALADNLVDNALKFTPEGGVTVRLAAAGASAVLTVEDTGIGIPPDELPLLFRRFHRARNTAAYRGSGLGLALVKAVAERHGGYVSAENTERGARFTVTLPRTQR